MDTCGSDEELSEPLIVLSVSFSFRRRNSCENLKIPSVFTFWSRFLFSSSGNQEGLVNLHSTPTMDYRCNPPYGRETIPKLRRAREIGNDWWVRTVKRGDLRLNRSPRRRKNRVRMAVVYLANALTEQTRPSRSLTHRDGTIQDSKNETVQLLPQVAKGLEARRE